MQVGILLQIEIARVEENNEEEDQVFDVLRKNKKKRKKEKSWGPRGYSCLFDKNVIKMKLRAILEEKFFNTDHRFCDLKWKSMNFWNPQMLKIFGKSMV